MKSLRLSTGSGVTIATLAMNRIFIWPQPGLVPPHSRCPSARTVSPFGHSQRVTLYVRPLLLGAQNCSGFRLIPSFYPAFVRYFGFSAEARDRPKVFDLLVNFWSERRDLNSGPPVPQYGAPKRNSQVIVVPYAVLRWP